MMVVIKKIKRKKKKKQQQTIFNILEVIQTQKRFRKFINTRTHRERKPILLKNNYIQKLANFSFILFVLLNFGSGQSCFVKFAHYTY